jgi:hypothetical protein
MRVAVLRVLVPLCLVVTSACNCGGNINPPVLPDVTLPDGVVGTAYDASVAVTGGKAPFMYTAGGAPPGITLTTEGKLTGTPTAAGDYMVQVHVDDSGMLSAEKTYALHVSDALAFKTMMLPDGTAGSPYSQTIETVGGKAPVTLAASGVLPMGLMFDPMSATLSGTPAMAGPATVTFTATDAASKMVMKTFMFTITAPLVFNPGPLPDGNVGVMYTAQPLTATGGKPPLAFTVSAGALPNGISLATSGAITGTPTNAGMFMFTVTVTDANMATATHDFTVHIFAGNVPVVTTMMLPNAVVGQSYTANLQGSGGSIPYTWSLGTGTLPAGLTLGTNGAITGTPTAAGPSTFTVKLTDANMQVATGQLTITVFPALMLGTMMLNEGYVTNAYAQTLMASGGQTPYMWSLAGGALPMGLTLTSGGILAGTPASGSAGSYGIALQVADASGQTQQAALTLNIYDLPTVSTVSLANGAVNAPYTQMLSAAGGKQPYTFTLAAGTLPAGLTLAAGAIAGVPTATAVAPITVQVADANGKTGQKNFTLSIFNGLVITSPNPPDSDVGATYSQTLSAVGGQTPYTWSISSGSLPPGITLSSSGGTLSGSPTTAGTYTFTVTATDAANMTFAKQFTVQIFTAPSITTTSLPGVYSGSAYTAMLAGTGGKTPYSFSISSGTLPAGVSLSSAGVLSGTTTITGTFPLTVTLTDANNVTASKPLTLTVVPALAVTTTSLADAYVGTPYSGGFAATGGVSPYTFAISAGMLPAGIILNGGTGALSGTATAASAPTFTVQVTDSAGKTATAQLTLAALAPPSITTVSLSDAYVGSGYSGSIAGNGGRTPYSFAVTVGALPNGLSLSASGAITGTPTAIGGSSFTVQITDANGVTGSKMLMLAVDAPLVLTTVFADAYVGTAYSQALSATGGKTPYTWSISAGALPAGLMLMAASSTVAGTPSTAGTANFTLTVTDANGSSSSTPFTVNVFAAPTITTTTLPDGYPSLPYNAAIAFSGGKAPYTFSISAGALPMGVSINAGSGALSGAPSGAPGTASFTVQLKDANNVITTAPLSIVVRTSVSVTTTSLPDGYVTSGYNQTLMATGGKPGYTWSVGSGTLPAGLMLSAAGALSGTPTAANTYSFTAVATDANGVQASQPLTVQTYALPQVTTTSPLPSAYNGTLYNQTLTVAGGKPGYTWSLSSGTPPAGITLSATGVLNGTPSAAGTSMFTVQVQDSNGKTGTAMMSLTVLNGFNITTASVPDGYTSTAYSVMLNAAGGQSPYSNWQVISGALPTGLNIAAATGVISGTPTVTGPASFTVQVQDNLGMTTNKPFTLTVYTPPSITTSSLNDGYIGVAYNQTLMGANGKAPYSWAVTTGTLPVGVTLTASTGVIAGSPSGSAGASPITVTLTDANGKTATQSLTLNVYAKPTVNPATPPDGYLTVAYNLALAETGGKAPFAWNTVGSLPAGLLIGGTTGAITGMPTATGTVSFSAQVTDANSQSGTLPLSITTYALPSITTTTLPGAFLNVAYSAPVMETGGKAPLTWSISGGAQPPGISISPSTGTLSGTPTASGTFNFTVTVLDANGKPATQALSIVVAAPLVITRTSLNDAYRTVAYSDMMTATGGKTPYTYAITNGTLPSGILMSNAGVFSGSPTAAAVTQTIIVQVTDANNTTATQSLTLNVYDSPAVTTSSLPDGYNTAPYAGATLAASGGKAPLAWSLASGSLPVTLTLTGGTGVIGGTVAAGATTQTFTVKVTDANNQTATRMLTLNVYALPSLAATAPNDGYAGGAYTWTFNASGGKPALTWSNTAGTLPTGLILNPANGTLSGTFQASIANGTVFNFTITVSDANAKFDSKPFSITVYQSPTISPTSPVVGTEGVTYMRSPGVPEGIVASGGKAPLSYAITGLPAGLAVSSTTGVISGIPNQNDSATSPYALTYRVTDANGVMTTTTPSMTIVAPQPILGSGGTVSIAPQGSAITDQVTVFVTDTNQLPQQNAGVRLRKNGVEFSPVKQAVTDVNGKAWFSGLGLNGTTDTLDVTVNGKYIANASLLNVNAALVTVNTFAYPIPEARSQAGAVWDVSLSKMLMFGGFVSFPASAAATVFTFFPQANDVVRLDTPASASWSEQLPPGMQNGPTPRQAAAVAYTSPNTTVLFGGTGDWGGVSNDTWRFNSTNNTWAPIGGSGGPSARYGSTMSSDTVNGAILFSGTADGTAPSNDVWQLQPAGNWVSKGPFPILPAFAPRFYAASATQTVSRKILICGGTTGGSPLNPLNSCATYDPVANTWTTAGNIPGPRYGLSMAAVPGADTVYMFGGCNSTTTCMSDLYQYTAGAWTALPANGDVPSPRQGASMVVDNTGKIIVFGGQDVNGNPLDETFVYDPSGALPAWTQTGPNYPSPTRWTISGTVTNGSTIAGASNRVRIYATGASGFQGIAVAGLSGGTGTYSLGGVPPGDTVSLYAWNFSVVSGVKTDRNFLSLGTVGPVNGNVTQNVALPSPPATENSSTFSYNVPSDWPAAGYNASASPNVYRAGYDGTGFTRNGTPNGGNAVSWYTPGAGLQEDAQLAATSSAVVSCEWTAINWQNIAPGALSTATLLKAPRNVSPGANECEPFSPPGFQQASVTPLNGGTYVSTGDINGDGFADFAVTNAASGVVSTLLSNGLGSVGPAFNTTPFTTPFNNAIGDVNGDGRADLAVGYQNGIQVLAGNGSGTFGGPIFQNNNSGVRGIALADVNGDGLPDYVFTEFTTGLVHVYTNNGTNYFAGASGQPQPRDIAVNDFNGDGRQDLVLVGTSGIALLMGTPTGFAAPVSTPMPGGYSASHMVLASMHGGTAKDVVVDGVSGTNTGIVIFTWNGTSLVGTLATTVAGANPGQIVAGDFNSDGKIDVATTFGTPNEVFAAQGDGAGGLAAMTTVPLTAAGFGLAAGDVNKDGKVDLGVTDGTNLYVELQNVQWPTVAESAFTFNVQQPGSAQLVQMFRGAFGMSVDWQVSWLGAQGPATLTLPQLSTLVAGRPAPSGQAVAWQAGSISATTVPFNWNNVVWSHIRYDSQSFSGGYVYNRQ